MRETFLYSTLKKIKASLLGVPKFYNHLRQASANIDKPAPIYTNSVSNGLKVHLGAGPINIQGWLNIDARQAPHIHIVTEVLELNEFSNGSISEIYMCHVLEHFSLQEVDSLVAKFHEKLTKGGILRLSVPDFDKLVTVYQAEENDLSTIRWH
jgi:hypothetical protein